MDRIRCDWVNDDPLYIAYHDEEWGVPVRDDCKLFELLLLEGAQAGLSWYTILKKREGYRRAFDGFDPERMSRYGDQKIAALLADEGIVRNRLKVHAAVGNARAWLGLRESGEGFADLLWSFTGGKPIINEWRRLEDVPASSPASQAMSRELKRRGFRFVGPTICYAFMQAAGMVNDHLVSCFRWAECGGAARPCPPPTGPRPP
ncbi:MAG: DNA-3-methyladenine glycosylase I [Gemmatimonadetes bacterium]|nr:DNA-3-methyladenine glycosylase I [Gemmatimonadota bacterium]MYE17757.1 DNA-3-methyladenine glycosylase I [Gemmatimonadota bacterium]